MSGSISATTLAYIGTAVSVASAGIGAIGSMKSGSAAAASENYNAQVQAQNAEIAKQDATRASQAGEALVGQEAQKTRATVGAIKSAQAANGIDVNTGSAIDVRSSAKELGQLSAINIRSSAARAAYADQTQSSSYKAQSELDKFDAGQEEIAGEVGAGSTLLGGFGNASSKYSDYLNKSSFSGGG